MSEIETEDLNPDFLDKLDELFESDKTLVTGIVFGDHGPGVVTMIFRDNQNTYFGDVTQIQDVELNQFRLITRLSRGEGTAVNWQLFKGWIVKEQEGYVAYMGERKRDEN